MRFARGFERYEIVCELGSGAMATVYLARTKSTLGVARLVAIKCCHAHLENDERLSHMFLAEAKIASRIHHPNVVAVLDAGRTPALHLVMEYVSGVTLAELAKKRLTPEEALRVGLDVLEGLAAAHELEGDDGRPMDVVHRDVSPRNVLVGEDGIARLTDFGIAKMASHSLRTRTGELRGTLAYMAPEQIDPAEIGVSAIDARADLFAWGALMHGLVTGTPLFLRETEGATLRAILTAQAPALRETLDVDPRLDDLLRWALAKRPADRPRSARELARAIRSASLPIASTAEIGARVRACPGRIVSSALAPSTPSPARSDEGLDEPRSEELEPVSRPLAPRTLSIGADRAHVAAAPVQRQRRWIGVAITTGAAAVAITAAVWLALATPEPERSAPNERVSATTRPPAVQRAVEPPRPSPPEPAPSETTTAQEPERRVTRRRPPRTRREPIENERRLAPEEDPAFRRID